MGGSVAVSSDDTIILVGAGSGPTITVPGRVRVYTSDGPGTAWTAGPDLTADDGTVADLFGYEVALSSDGSTAVIAAATRVGAWPGPGRVYVFTRSGQTWTQVQMIPSPSGMGSEFGDAIGISADGRNFVVGAPCAEGSTCNGAAYFFSRPTGSSTWSLNTTSTCATATGGLCGVAVDMSEDGTVAAIGQPYYKTVSGSTTTRRPYVYTYTKAATSTSWTYQAALASPSGDNASTNFGYYDTIALSGTGNVLVVGAPNLQYENGGYVAGGVFTYTYSGTSWGTPTLIIAPATSGSPLRQFGYSVDVSADGLKLIVGAPQGSATTAAGGGIAFYSTRSSISNTWTLTSTYLPADLVSTDMFGMSVAIPASATHPVIGAPFKNVGATAQAGAAYIY